MFAHKAHGYAASIGVRGVGRILHYQRQVGDVIADFGLADLQLRSDGGSYAENNQIPGIVRLCAGLALLVQ